MALPRKQLQEKLENITPETVKETMQWILDGHTASLEAVQEERDTFKNKAETVDALTKERDEWKAKAEASGDVAKIQADFDAYKQQIADEKAAAGKDAALRKALRAAGVQRDEFVDLLMGRVDLSTVEMEGDTVKNAAAVIDPMKTAYAGCFGTPTTAPVPPVTPPVNNPPATYTREQIAAMSPEEINKNWDAIKPSLASLK